MKRFLCLVMLAFALSVSIGCGGGGAQAPAPTTPEDIATNNVKSFLDLCSQGRETEAVNMYWKAEFKSIASTPINVRSYEILDVKHPSTGNTTNIYITVRIDSSNYGGMPINQTWDFICDSDGYIGLISQHGTGGGGLIPQ